jgi:hypothetical protein
VDSAQGAIQHRVQRYTQLAMIVVAQGNEAKGLQIPLYELARRTEHFGHAMYRAGLGLERNFDEVALLEGSGQMQQSTGGGDGLQFGLGALPVIELDGSRDRTA